MLVTEQERLRESIEQWLEAYGSGRTALMPVLQEIQTACGYVSDYAMQIVADRMDVSPAEVHGVVSFYSFLTDKPLGTFVIRLCRTISCDMLDKDRVARQFENDLGIRFGETTPDGMFTLEYTNCLGMCDQGPALLVNDKLYTRVSPEKVHAILDDCRAEALRAAGQAKEPAHE